MTIRMHSFCWDYSIITNETKQNKSRSQMLLYFALSQSHPQTVKLKVKHMQICIGIDCTTISTLHKLIDKWLTRSVQNICNSLDAFKPWRSIILAFICTKFIPDVLKSCASWLILSKNSVGVNLVTYAEQRFDTFCSWYVLKWGTSLFRLWIVTRWNYNFLKREKYCSIC